VTGVTERLSLTGAMGWFAVSYGIAIVGYLALNSLASRLLGPADFGYFVIALTVATLVGQLGLAGVHRSGLREAARLDTDDEEGLRELRRGVRAVSLTTLPAAAVACGAVTFVLAGAYNSPTRWSVALAMVLLVMLGGQQRVVANFLRGLGQTRLASLLEGRSGGAAVAVAQAALLALVLVLAPQWGLPGALGAAALGYAIPVLLARRRLGSRWRHLRVRGRLLGDLRAVLRRDWRFTSNQVATQLNSSVELWIAGVVLSSVDTSLFGAAQRLAFLLVVPLSSLQVVFAPAVARLIGSHDSTEAERLLRTGSTLASAVTVLFWLPMVAVPGPLLGVVFGAAFEPAALVLVLLAVGYLANAFVGLCGTALIMSHHEGAVATMNWVAAISRVAVGLAAAAAFGLVGLGVSTVVITAATFAGMWLITRRRLGIGTHLTLRPDLGPIKRTAS